MAQTPVPITPAELEHFFQLWKTGLHVDEIKIHMGIGDARYDWHQPEFLFYCRNQTVKEFRTGMAAGTYRHIPLTFDRRSEFLDHCGSGLSITEAAEYMGIPLPTVLDVWFKEDQLLKFEVDQIRLLLNAKVVAALYKRAVGRQYMVKSKTKTEGKGEKGMVDTVSVTETERVVEPDVNACMAWLTNRMPEQWSKDGQRPLGGNKGTILGAIESSVSQNTPDEDADYDRLQLEHRPAADPYSVLPRT